MLAEIVTTHEVAPVKTISLELYAAIVLERESLRLCGVQMVGLLDEPAFLGNSYILAGYACPEDETPFYYRISTTDARLISLEEKPL